MFSRIPGLQPLDSSSPHPHPMGQPEMSPVLARRPGVKEGKSPLVEIMGKLFVVPLRHIDKQLPPYLGGSLAHNSDKHKKTEPHDSRSCCSILINLSFESTLRQEHVTLTFRASSLAQLFGVFKRKQNRKTFRV